MKRQVCLIGIFIFLSLGLEANSRLPIDAEVKCSGSETIEGFSGRLRILSINREQKGIVMIEGKDLDVLHVDSGVRYGDCTKNILRVTLGADRALFCTFADIKKYSNLLELGRTNDCALK